MQMVHAACDMPADTEVTFWYMHPTGDHKYMEEKCKHWGFQCKCAICEESRNLSKSVARKRKNLMDDLKVVLAAAKLDASKAERLLLALNQTYKHPTAEVPRFPLREAYFKLAVHYSNKRKAEKSVEMALKSLECLGFVINNANLPAQPGTDFVIEKWGIVTDDVVGIWILICMAYVTFAPHMLRKAVECAKLAYKMCVGEDESFRERYDKNNELPI